MKSKKIAFSAVCLLCSMVLFPLFALGGVLALVILAAGAETLRVLRLLMGGPSKHDDLSAARTVAGRICYGRLYQS